MNQTIFNNFRIEYIDSLLRAVKTILKELCRLSPSVSNFLLWTEGPSTNGVDDSAFSGVSLIAINVTQILQAEY